MPLDLDLARNAGDPDARRLAERETVPDPELGAVEPALGLEAREARLALPLLQAAEERLERLVEPAEHLLFGGVGVERQPFIGGTDGFEFVRLIEIAQADPTTTIGFDALLKPGVVEVAKSAEHSGQSIGLSTVRVEPELVGQERHGSDALLGRADVPD